VRVSIKNVRRAKRGFIILTHSNLGKDRGALPHLHSLFWNMEVNEKLQEEINREKKGREKRGRVKNRLKVWRERRQLAL